MAEECEEEKRRRLEEQFVWPDSPRLSYNGEEDHKNDYMTIMRKKTKTAKLSRFLLLLQQTSKTHPIPGIFLRALNNQLLAWSQLPTLEIPKKKTAQNSRR